MTKHQASISDSITHGEALLVQRFYIGEEYAE